VLTVPGSDTIYTADVIMTITYSVWSLDLITIAFSFGVVGGRVVWVLRKYLAEEESAGRKSNAARDVRAGLRQVLLLLLSLQSQRILNDLFLVHRRLCWSLVL